MRNQDNVASFFGSQNINLYIIFGNEFHKVNGREIERRIKNMKDGCLLLFVSKGKKRYVPPSIDIGGCTFLMTSIRFFKGNFLIMCEIAGSDIGKNTDGECEFTIKQLMGLIEQEKKYARNTTAKNVVPSDYIR